MTDHPCKGLSKAAVAAFERIAISMPPKCTDKTLAALISRGVIVAQDRIIPPDRSCPWPVTIKEYHVPTPIHMQWCKWCDENVTDAEIGREAGGRAADL